jgi:MFS family permease
MSPRPVDGAIVTLTSLLLLGVFYAATDGVLAALVSRLTPSESRGTAIAAAQTVVALARFFASVGFGALWMVLDRGPPCSWSAPCCSSPCPWPPG